MATLVLHIPDESLVQKVKQAYTPFFAGRSGRAERLSPCVM